MKEKSFIAVITLVSKNKKCYSLHRKYIIDTLSKYEIKEKKTTKLSKFVEDYFIKVNNVVFENLKKSFKLILLNGSDLCIQKNIYRKKKIIACDMDKTVIRVETIDLIGDKLLNNNHISKLTEKAMNGSINFNKSILERTKILKGISAKEILKIIKYIKITKDAEKVIKTMNNEGCHTMLISGGYEILANVIGKKIGFKEVVSNKPILSDGMLTGELKGSVIDGRGKLNSFKKSVKRLNIKNYETLAVGDGQNDIDIIKYASLGISWNGFPNVNKSADALARSNFKSILYFQGYSDNEIVY